MSEHGLLEEHEDDYVPGGRRRKSRGGKGCLAVLVAFAVLAGGYYLGLDRGVQFVKDQFDSVEDYPGPGTGKVEFEVNEGDTTAQIGRNLKEAGVTKSVQAFLAAAAA